MPAMVEDLFLDSGLAAAKATISAITICANEPTTYALATTGASSTQFLGSFNFTANSAFTGPSAGAAPTGRKLVSNTVTNGTILTSGTAAWWAAIGTANSSLYAHGSLSASQPVTAGNTFTLGAFEIRIANQ
jgi:hypothetical protein